MEPTMKRYDFDWNYVGIEQRESEFGEWVRYEDALAFYSKELDNAYAEGRKDEQERCASLCESLKSGDSTYAVAYYDNALDDAAAAIRSGK
jgi:hypothetical protein